MAAALYDPQRGYYTAQVRSVGRRGDFSTSATLSQDLPAAVARWIRTEWAKAGRKLPLIECGPGAGVMHDRVLDSLGFGGRWGLRSCLVERSPVLRREQEQTLRRRRGVRWFAGMQEALAECGGEALIFSNELVDAFPATLLEWDGEHWREVWLELTVAGGIAETLRACSDDLLGSACRLSWAKGQRVEVLLSYRDWMYEWCREWKAGAMLTIDYGGAPAEVYYRRPGGTVRGYLHHQRLSAGELYACMGRCDVTVDVNFTDLEEWGRAAGLEATCCITQQEFIYPGSSETEGSLRRPENEAFQCLIQRPGR